MTDDARDKILTDLQVGVEVIKNAIPNLTKRVADNEAWRNTHPRQCPLEKNEMTKGEKIRSVIMALALITTWVGILIL